METKTEKRSASVEASTETETVKNTAAKKKSPVRSSESSSAEKKPQSRSPRTSGRKKSTATTEKAIESAPNNSSDAAEKPVTEKEPLIEESVSSEKVSAPAEVKKTQSARKTAKAPAKSAKKEFSSEEKTSVEAEKPAEEKTEEKLPELSAKAKKGSTRKTASKKTAENAQAAEKSGDTVKVDETAKTPDTDPAPAEAKASEEGEKKPAKRSVRTTKKTSSSTETDTGKTVKTSKSAKASAEKATKVSAERAEKQEPKRAVSTSTATPSIEEKLEAMAKKAKKTTESEVTVVVIEQLAAEIPTETATEDSKSVPDAPEKITEVKEPEAEGKEPETEAREIPEESGKIEVSVESPAPVASPFVQAETEQTVDVSGTPHDTFVFYSPSQLAAMEAEAERKKAIEAEPVTEATTATEAETVIESDEDPKLNDAIKVVLKEGKASTSLLQRRLLIGYGRSAKLIDRMEELGIVAPADGNKSRAILLSKEEALSRYGVVIEEREEAPTDQELDPLDSALFAAFASDPVSKPVPEKAEVVVADEAAVASASDPKAEITGRPERRSASQRRSDPHEREVMDKDTVRANIFKVLGDSAELERRTLIEETMRMIPLTDEERRDNHPTSLSNRVRSVIGSVLAEELAHGTIVASGRRLTLPQKAAGSVTEENVPATASAEEREQTVQPKREATLEIEIEFEDDRESEEIAEEKKGRIADSYDEDAEDAPFEDDTPTSEAMPAEAVDASVAPTTNTVREGSIRRSRQPRGERRTSSQTQGGSAVLITEDELERVILNALRRSSATKADLFAVLKRTYVDPNRFSKEEENRIYNVAGNVLQKLVNRGTLQNNDGRYLQKPSQRVLNPGRAPGASFTGNVETRFITELNRQSGDFFEQFAARLLEKYFEMSNIRVDASYVVGGSDDNGIDIMLETTDWLGYKERVFVQAKKRATQPVTLKEVREFYGALCAEEGTRGVFITTSSFCMEASKMIGKIRNLIAIDKRKLFALAEHCEVGLVRDEEGRLLLDENLFLDYDV
ncbi:MAG: restriction endonuclease [Clostridia bacterium]|nr:restriction endonuclease [Clostridia bacterium]